MSEKGGSEQHNRRLICLYRGRGSPLSDNLWRLAVRDQERAGTERKSGQTLVPDLPNCVRHVLHVIRHAPCVRKIRTTLRKDWYSSRDCHLQLKAQMTNPSSNERCDLRYNKDAEIKIQTQDDTEQNEQQY